MSVLVIISCIIFCASLISGMLSFGFALVAIPFMSIFLSPIEVVGLITLLNFFNSLLILSKQRRNIEWKHISYLLVGGIIGVPFGVHLLDTVNPGMMKILIGILIIILGTFLLLGYSFTIKKHKHKIMSGAGLLGGILAGGTGIIGSPIAIFFKSMGMKKKEFRANIIIYLSIMAGLTISIMYLKGMIGKESFSNILVLLPVMLLGIHLGHTLGDWIAPGHFKKIVIIVAIIAGGMSIVKGFGMM